MVDPQQIVNILNDLLKKDESGMVALLSLVVPTKLSVLEDYDVRFGSRSADYPQLGLLTILNKVIESSGQKIEFCYNTNSQTMEMEPQKFKLKKV